MDKKIPPAVDVVGRLISWRPVNGKNRIYAEVIGVGFKPEKCDPMKVLFGIRFKKYINVMTMLNQTIKLPCEQKDIKELNIVVEKVN